MLDGNTHQSPPSFAATTASDHLAFVSRMAGRISLSDAIEESTGTLNVPALVQQDRYGQRSHTTGRTVKPLRAIALDEPLKLEKNGSVFTLKRMRDGYYVCSCPAWRFSQERDKFRKTCVHLSEVLGEQYERERTALAREAASGTTRVASSAARVAHAKTVLENRVRELSQQNPPSPMKRAQNTGASESGSETEEEQVDDCPKQRQPEAGPSRPRSHPATPPAQTHEQQYIEREDDGPSPSKRAKREDQVALLLAKPWPLDADPSKPRSKAMDPTGWWISEKVSALSGALTAPPPPSANINNDL